MSFGTELWTGRWTLINHKVPVVLLVMFSMESLRNHGSPKCKTLKVREEVHCLGRGHISFAVTADTCVDFGQQHHRSGNLPQHRGLRWWKEPNGENENVSLVPKSPRKHMWWTPVTVLHLSYTTACLLPHFLNYYSFSSSTLRFSF